VTNPCRPNESQIGPNNAGDVDGRARQHIGDGRVVGGLGEVDADEAEPSQEAVDRLGIEQLSCDESAQLSMDLVAVSRLVEPGPGHGDDSGVGAQFAVAVTQVERGQQLAHGEVTRTAEDHEVAGVNHAAHGRQTLDASQTHFGT
jgi:hypothetical protein